MTSIRKLRCLGRNDSGDQAGISIPKDDLRLEGLLDEEGQLVDRPQVAVDRLGNGEWRIRILDEGAVPSASD